MTNHKFKGFLAVFAISPQGYPQVLWINLFGESTARVEAHGGVVFPPV